MPLKYIRPILAATAAIDVIAGCILIYYVEIFVGSDQAPSFAIFLDLIGALLAAFGVGMWFCFVEPVRNKDIIKIAIVAKLALGFIVIDQFSSAVLMGKVAGIAAIPIALVLAACLWTLSRIEREADKKAKARAKVESETGESEQTTEV